MAMTPKDTGELEEESSSELVEPFGCARYRANPLTDGSKVFAAMRE